MAARIPVIEQTSQAGGAAPGYLPSVQGTDAIGRGISNLGNALGDVATAQQDLANAQLHRDKISRQQDAAIWAGQTLSNAQLQWQQTLQQDKTDPTLTANGAEGFTPQILTKYDAWAKDALEKAPDADSKRYLAQHLSALRTSIGDNAIGFEAKAKTDYRVDTVLNSMDSGSQAVMGAPTKDNFLTVYAQQKAIVDALQVEPEVRTKLNDKLREKMVTGYWLGRIRQDPTGAAKELQQGLGPSELDRWKYGSPAQPGSTGGAPATGDVASLWPALINQESGGSQGAVSPKGAIGAAQVMPDTAPEAARLAGLPFDPNRLKTDRAYNEALGQAYLQKQLQTFGGDQAKALAAYNMGPGSADKGNGVAGLVQKYGDQWLDHAPAETQNYVKSILGRVGGGGARPVLLADASGGLPGQDYGYGTRPDGTLKGKGFLGEVQRPDGAVMTEYTVGVNIGGKEMDIPTLVPTLTKGEVDQLRNLQDGQPIPQPIIQKAVDHARSRIAAGKSVYADNPGAGEQGNDQQTGNSILDATPMPIRLQMMQHADSEMSRMQGIWRSQVSNTENDHIAAYMNGQPVATPLSQDDYVRAYGPLEGVQRFENYKSIAAVGGDISAMKLATPEQLAATVARYVPDSTKPGYDAAMKRYQLVATAADQVNKTRQDDPIAYAEQAKIGNANPLDFSNADKFSAELRNRTGVAETMQAKYGTPYQLLSKAEAQTLQQGFQGMTTQQKIGYLSSINKAVTDPRAYRAVMQQIAPDSPVTAVAGNILQKQNPLIIPHTFSADETYTQQDVASRILEGEALINPTKATKSEDGKGKLFPMPKDQDIRDAFNNVVGKAFAGDPIAADAAYQAVKAYYAGQGSKDGDVSGQLDSTRLKTAINAVVGVSDVNGKGEVVRPWGMPEQKFQNNLQAAFDQQMAASGLKGTSQDNFGAYGLQMVQDSKYLMRTGTGYLVDKAGNPIVLDLTTKPSLAYLIPGASQPVEPPQPAPPGTVVQPKTAKMTTAHPGTK